MRDFDLIVIGGGSGGIAMARRAASYGARVAVIEARKLGGTCVNVGCVPKKLMFNAATLAEQFRSGSDYGFKVDEPKIDWAGVKHRRDKAVARLNSIYEANLTADKIEILVGRAKLTSKGAVEVNGRKLSAPHTVIAVGGYPRVPDIPGAQLGITSNGFFELETQPKHVAVVGAGYIGVELAGIFNSLGSQVSLISRYDTVLPRFDALIQDELREALEQQHVDFQPNAEAKRLARTDNGLLKLTMEDGRELGGYDCVLWAAGRAPASAGLLLERANVQTDDRGFIKVDDWQNTTADGIYAIGDITGQPALTPVAVSAGRKLADRLFGKDKEAKLDIQDIPTVVFSHPPVATVGLSESQARKSHDEVKCYTSRFTNLFYSLGDHKPKTSIKLVTVGPSERVVGVHIFGMNADEMLQGFAVALKMGATKRDFDNTLPIHPTAAEELVTLR